MKIIRNIAILMSMSFCWTACEDLKFWNNFLEKPAGDEMTIDSVFSSKQYADQALRQVYKSLPDFLPSMLGYNAEAFIHDVYSDIGYTERLSWNHGAITSSSGYSSLPYQLSFGESVGDPTYGIRKAYIYLENVDRVKDMSDEEKNIRKAEAKVIIATHYIMMFRFYGGVPWIDHAFAADEIFDMPRMTVDETVKKTVALLDKAAAVLPWYTTDEEYGHMTAAAAIALKFRMLLFAASPLFNSNEPYYSGVAADQKLTWYGDYQQQRWQDALDAGLEFLRLNADNNNYYEISTGTGNPREDYVNGYFVKGNHEVIMPTFRWGTYINGNKAFRMYNDGYGAPRPNYADMFQWKADGSDFDWNNTEHAASPFFDAAGNETRDPRLYETLLVNGDKWQGRKADLSEGGREGYPSPTSGWKQKTQYGYGFRKFIRDMKDESIGMPYSCPFIRIPEIYLGIAEAMNQLGKAESPDEFGRTAYDYLNIVRKRAGMPSENSMTVTPGDELTEYLLDERAREFGQEDMRYFDLIRYKKGNDWAARPMEILSIKKAGNKFIYTQSIRNDIAYLWKEYWYLLPFPVDEINKKYGLVQNPGW